MSTSMTYIRVPAVWDKLRTAEKTFRPVLMLAQAGYGKTTAVDHYYRRRPALRLSALSGVLDFMPEPDRIRQGVIIVDNLSWLTDSESEAYLLRLMEDRRYHLVLIGRGHIPAWMALSPLRAEFVHITAQDLAMDTPLIQKLFHSEGVPLPEEDAALIRKVMMGYPPAVLMALSHAKQGQPMNRTTFASIRIELFHYHELAFWQLWKEPVRQLLLSVCRVDSFSPEMASHLSGLDNVNELLDYCRAIGSFLNRVAPEKYELIEEVRVFLMWKQDMTWSREDIAESYRKSADYYLQTGQIAKALDWYQKADAAEQIRQVLIENTLRHPGIGAYDEIRRHYEFLKPEDIQKHPELLYGVCLMYSLMARPEKSEEAYRNLIRLRKPGTLSESVREEAVQEETVWEEAVREETVREAAVREETVREAAVREEEIQREAGFRTALLDIALPHRAGRDLPDAIKRLKDLISPYGMDFSDLSLTHNCPSLMNGAYDFCAAESGWLTREVLAPLEELLGAEGMGLADLTLGEIGFERGEMSADEITAHLSRGYAAAGSGGNIELCFAAQGLLIRRQVAEGNLPGARESLHILDETLQAEKASFLFPSLHALKAWLLLYAPGGEDAGSYVDALPDPRQDFYLMKRFGYQIRIRYLIAQGRNQEALDLVSYLAWYYEQYGREYLSIENDFLRAVILYRIGEKSWKAAAKRVLCRAEEKKLTRVISMEGAAALPLLAQLLESPGRNSHSPFQKKLLAETRQMALSYPRYLQQQRARTVRLTGREQEVLAMLCAGNTTEEICDMLSISYSTLKKHNRCIYARLGVKTRVEAEREALRLGLVK